MLEVLLGMWEAAAESAVWPKYPPTDPNSYPDLHSPPYYGSWAPWADGVRGRKEAVAGAL